ncbi:MAG: hypothetical protein HC918_00060 [Oscillatoriales cyanobacterium SM2_1_8]|nr:hypothetical protein [Oscillatoriales cyanobacterium SM2_1_8]
MSYRHHKGLTELRLLSRLAHWLRQRGYEVVMQPAAKALPPEAGYPFDLVAAKGDRHLAVEVRHRERLGLNGQEDLRAMAQAIAQVPHWRFDLVVTDGLLPPSSARLSAAHLSLAHRRDG